MLFRKISALIEDHLKSGTEKILLVDGARQVGKTYIIRYVGQQLFQNFIEVNMVEDSLGSRLFANTKTVEDFYLQVSMLAGDRMKERENTLIFIDEIQAYPHLLTLLKFLAQDGRFTYIASGSLLGITLAETPSIPMGSIRKVRMFPLDFEEFLFANGMNDLVIASMRKKFERLESLDQAMHDKIMDLFRKYLLVGGLPDAVNSYLAEKNIQRVREIQREIHDYYAADASRYDEERKLQIRRVYDLIPSNMENKKKRVVAKDIEGKKGKTFADYQDEFEYLISAGIALHVQAVSNPVFPLIESAGKNLLKLYLNDVGILSGILYGNNIRAILDDVRSVNLGAVYETVVATELAAHGHRLFYYDNRSKGEVDYLVDDYDSLSVAPIEVKSGRDYTIHSALNSFVKNEDYHIKRGYVLSNEREVSVKGKIVYLPIYYIMFFQN
ncbi:ATP-binding protein [Pseudoflavonifractor phocaeensis]|uniref:ATP-binding protein n=1 Tax=Pseudoflavonifractor phocaeensis TaxID=1870988 RepID=UPI001956D83A|nr:AAA family ATPase [Pseudoflavonifractor phocaeensis]MBM6884364.1 ATP-binding protein [Pseudoflavonifractor phocaeensis]